MKQVDSVEDFVRGTVLPERDFEAVVDSAIEEIHANSSTIRECREIRQRIGRLEEIIAHFTHVEQLYSSEGVDALRQDMIAQAAGRVESLRHRRRRTIQMRRLDAAEQALGEMEADLATKKDELSRLETLIARSDSGKLFEAKEQLEQVSSAIAARSAELATLLRAIDPLGIRPNAGQEQEWAAIGAKLEDIRAGNQLRIDELGKMLTKDRARFLVLMTV